MAWLLRKPPLPCHRGGGTIWLGGGGCGGPCSYIHCIYIYILSYCIHIYVYVYWITVYIYILSYCVYIYILCIYIYSSQFRKLRVISCKLVFFSKETCYIYMLFKTEHQPSNQHRLWQLSMLLGGSSKSGFFHSSTNMLIGLIDDWKHGLCWSIQSELLSKWDDLITMDSQLDCDAFFKMDPNLGSGWFSDNTKHANHIIIIVNEVGFPQNGSNAKECQYNIQQYVEI